MRLFFLIAGFFFAVQVLATPAVANGPLSVCQALAQVEKYRGKMVSIRGVELSSRRHGSVLRDISGVTECSEVTQRGRTWPAAISLESSNRGDVEDGPAPFEPDLRKLDDAERIMQGRNDLVMVVTLRGLFRSRKGIKIIRSPQGWYAGNGYAQSGQYPALLVIKTVMEAGVVERDKWMKGLVGH